MSDNAVTNQTCSSVQGTIESILNHGTIVQMLIKTDEGGIRYVNFDHRMFYNMVESLGCVPSKGERVIVHGEPYEETVEFPDLEDEP